MPTQAEKAVQFQALHQRPEVFIIANPWDAGTARLLTALGFPALSTTSAGLAFALGRRDGTGAVTREEALANARCIAEATPLPVAADLENGYGHSPEAAAETIRLAAEAAGLVGGSIEDGPAIRIILSTTFSTPQSASPPLQPLPGRLHSHSCSLPGLRITSTTAPISMTLSAVSRPMRPPALTSLRSRPHPS